MDSRVRAHRLPGELMAPGCTTGRRQAECIVLVLPLLMLSFRECASVNDTIRIISPFPNLISVSNRQIWGTWGTWKWCPTGTYATGFSLKVSTNQGIYYDTALNGIALYCSKPIGSNGNDGSYTTVRSDVSWGSWTQNLWCPSGVLTSFQLQVQSYQGWALDDSTANNIRYLVTKSSWSSLCGGTGICGIQTKVESPQGIGDDTSLNNARFFCCY
ncbi:vitelline membrane outer layer protein 1-like [Hemibagrus wyckioides]|uniref:vitelline membrane outer layer protein 1-like n=1 Tax=Hemibagrus wyckioides TaxID=337641 RepID=UPI00266D46C9|nr:vitelline membrane outer layer protein 1-like [Hemibagrus wyckioides]